VARRTARLTHAVRKCIVEQHEEPLPENRTQQATSAGSDSGQMLGA
jgi:hypothetical protein